MDFLLMVYEDEAQLAALFEEALAWATRMPAARTGRVEGRPIWNY